jgi:hypothetical protein
MEAPGWLTDAVLIAPVEALAGLRIERIDGWTATPVAGGAGETLGVWRVTGEATVDGAPTPFTLILKGWTTDGLQDSAAWDWPQRELRACASGLLADLPGDIAAPRCLGEVERADGTCWAWMTPMPSVAIARWELGHFALVARRLGRFNGAYLAGRPLPEADWLSRGWTRRWTESARESIELFDRYVAHPRVAAAFPPAERREIERLFSERHRWFDALDTLPQTFCHLDAFPRNAFLRLDPDGADSLGLVDWSFTGIAAVGEEIVALVSSSMLFGESGNVPIETLDQSVFASYVEGLRDAGWRGDERLVRMAYTGSLAMRYLIGPLRTGLPLLASPHAEAAARQRFGISYEAFHERVVRHNAWAHERADEFRVLLTGAPPRLPDAA